MDDKPPKKLELKVLNNSVYTSCDNCPKNKAHYIIPGTSYVAYTTKPKSL